MLENWKPHCRTNHENMDSTDPSIANFEKENEEKNKYFLKKEKELFEKGKGSVGLDAMDESHNDISPSEKSIDVEISPVDSEVLQPPADQERKYAGSVPDATSSSSSLAALLLYGNDSQLLAAECDVEEFCAMTDNHEVPGCPGKQSIEMDDVMTEIPTLSMTLQMMAVPQTLVRWGVRHKQYFARDRGCAINERRKCICNQR